MSKEILELLKSNRVVKSWYPILIPALESLDNSYLKWILKGEGYIPKRDKILVSFSTLEPKSIKYILFGQDPYPREKSAIGYAFIDGAVDKIFSDRGLSKEVNRATSLRNFIKMALVASNMLNCSNLSQEAIASIKKDNLIDNIFDLKDNFELNGVLLLNTALVFSSKEKSKRHIKEWKPFIKEFLRGMREFKPRLILFGSYALEIKKINEAKDYSNITLEHPYNHTFICNERALELFAPMELLLKRNI